MKKNKLIISFCLLLISISLQSNDAKNKMTCIIIEVNSIHDFRLKRMGYSWVVKVKSASEKAPTLLYAMDIRRTFGVSLERIVGSTFVIDYRPMTEKGDFSTYCQIVIAKEKSLGPTRYSTDDGKKGKKLKIENVVEKIEQNLKKQ